MMPHLEILQAVDVTRLDDEAYVLRTQELGENDLIVGLFTRAHGKVRGVARSARKSRRRFGGALAPLTHVRVAWVESAQRELHRLDAMECLRSFASMQSDPRIQATCAVFCEVSEAFVHEGQADEKAFKLLGAVLTALESGRDAWGLVRYFEYWMLRIHGLLPDLDSCSSCGRGLRRRRVDANGRIGCNSCMRGESVPGRTIAPADLAFLESARQRPPESIVATGVRLGSGGALEFLLRGTLESFAEKRFRTYRHLRAASGMTEAESGAP
jgi:DNA repair protein RecO (recombination protein O)